MLSSIQNQFNHVNSTNSTKTKTNSTNSTNKCKLDKKKHNIIDEQRTGNWSGVPVTAGGPVPRSPNASRDYTECAPASRAPTENPLRCHEIPAPCFEWNLTRIGSGLTLIQSWGRWVDTYRGAKGEFERRVYLGHWFKKRWRVYLERWQR